MSLIEVSAILGNMGEFVGAIAVVITLFYLALQVKHSKEATEANTRSLDEDRKVAMVQRYQSTVAAQISNMQLLTESPYMPNIILKVQNEGLESLTEEETYRYRRYSLSTLMIQEASYFAYQNGLEPDFPRKLKLLVQNSGWVWRHFNMLVAVPPGLQAEIERVMDELEEETTNEAVA